MMTNKKKFNKTNGKVIYGLTPEERLEEIRGMAREKWNAKQEEKFQAKTGMTYDEWYINKVKSTIPINFIAERNGTVTDDDVRLIKDLQALGLMDGVINVLIDYITIFSRIGMVHQLVREMGANWNKEKIFTIEKAITYVREGQSKK